MSVPYPSLPATAKVDHFITTDDVLLPEDEGGIEVKRLQFVGDRITRLD